MGVNRGVAIIKNYFPNFFIIISNSPENTVYGDWAHQTDNCPIGGHLMMNESCKSCVVFCSFRLERATFRKSNADCSSCLIIIKF